MPSMADRITEKFVGAYSADSVSVRSRQSRWRLFVGAFPDIADIRVLDLGGDGRSWVLAGVRPAHLTLVNLEPTHSTEAWMTELIGDACDPPELGEHDLVYSNSVIEHVGGHWRRERFAEVVRGAAPAYWVQTPYRYFPVEPHQLLPMLQYLPLALQARLVVASPVGNLGNVRDRDMALDMLMYNELLGASQMRAYFPDGELLRERFAGLTKSLISVRRR
jgi:hypothetical protein